MLDRSSGAYDVLSLQKRSFAAVLYARYRWFLAVIAAGALLLLTSRAALWVRRVYLASAGIPSLDRINAVVVVLDRQGRIIFANRNALVGALLGGDIRKRRRYDAAGSGLHPSMKDMIRRSFAEPFTPQQGQFEIGDGDIGRRVELTVYPRVDRRHQLLGKIVIGEDITGQVGWQRKAILGEAAQQWIHRLKGNMATAGIIIGNLLEDESAWKELSGRAHLRRSIDSLKTQVDQAAEVTGRILHFTRIGKPELAMHDINRVIDLVAGPYIENAPRGVTVAKMQQRDLPAVRIDFDQMAEVVDNLLANALNAVRGGGRVTIKTQPADDLLGADDGRAIRIVVEDTGVGIAPEDSERIFLPGFTRTVGGTGVGLALVKEIVENHGGRIRVESQLGRGSRFVVQIPVRG